MGLEYYHSIKEKEELQKKIGEYGYRVFNDYKRDENGNITDANSGMLTFGSQKLADDGINNEYHKISGRFQLEIEKIGIIEKYLPLLYQSHKKTLTELLQDHLNIHTNDELQNRIQKLKEKSHEVVSRDLFVTLSNILAYESIYQNFSSLENNPEQQKDYDLHRQLTEFILRLPDNSEFLREMGLVYLTAIFAGFIKNLVTHVLKLDNNLLIKSGLSKSHNMDEEIDKFTTSMTSGLDKIKEGMKTFNLNIGQDPDWKKFLEVFLRRNSFVHNAGFPSKKYEDSFPLHSSKERFGVSTKYLNDSIGLFHKFHRLIWVFFWENHVHSLWLQQLKNTDMII